MIDTTGEAAATAICCCCSCSEGCLLWSVSSFSSFLSFTAAVACCFFWLCFLFVFPFAAFSLRPFTSPPPLPNSLRVTARVPQDAGEHLGAVRARLGIKMGRPRKPQGPEEDEEERVEDKEEEEEQEEWGTLYNLCQFACPLGDVADNAAAAAVDAAAPPCRAITPICRKRRKVRSVGSSCRSPAGEVWSRCDRGEREGERVGRVAWEREGGRRAGPAQLVAYGAEKRKISIGLEP